MKPGSCLCITTHPSCLLSSSRLVEMRTASDVNMCTRALISTLNTTLHIVVRVHDRGHPPPPYKTGVMVQEDLVWRVYGWGPCSSAALPLLALLADSPTCPALKSRPRPTR